MYQPRIVWVLGLLMGVVWALAGCVAPDGSLIRLQQAPDGSIVGWQLDAPAGAVVTNTVTAATVKSATHYPPRPILYLDVWGNNPDTPVNAIDPDGGALGVVGKGQLPVLLGWSPPGDHFAYFAVDDESSAVYLEAAALGEEGKRLVDFDPDELTSYWGMAQAIWSPAAWSPDGSQIALTRGLVWEHEENSRVALVGSAGGEVTDEFPFPQGLTIPYTIDWSPDGQRLIVNGDISAILDIKSGRWAQIRDFPTIMEWLPDSNSVIYVNYTQEGTEDAQPAGLWRDEVGETPQQLLTSDQLLSFGLDVNQRLAFTLSPGATRIALLSSGAWNDGGSTLVVFDLQELQSGLKTGEDAPQPLAQWQLPEAITPVQWSPDGEALAFLKAGDDGVTLELLPVSESSSQRVALISAGDATQANEVLVHLINMPFQLLSWMP